MRKKQMLSSIIIVLFMLIIVPFQAEETTKITDASAITTATEAGSYPVTFQYTDENGKLITTTIYITIMYLRTTVSDQQGEGIDAHDIEVGTGIFDKLTDADLLTLTKAHAWNLADGTPVPITTITKTTKNKQLGKYQVTFKTDKGTATTINVLETVNNLATTRDFTYFSFMKQPYIWWSIFLVFLFMFLPLILVLLDCYKVQKETRKINHLLFREQQLKQQTESN